MATINLPISSIQPDFEAVINEVKEGIVPEDSFWLSFYKSGETSVHGKVTLTLDEKDRNLVLYEGKDGGVFNNRGKVSEIDFGVIIIHRAT